MSTSATCMHLKQTDLTLLVTDSIIWKYFNSFSFKKGRFQGFIISSSRTHRSSPLEGINRYTSGSVGLDSEKRIYSEKSVKRGGKEARK